jgi:nitroreductase/NAD-dependent dihydropyrimidine dehydrogenase PreA subunit
MKNLKLAVDANTCLRCGLCAKDCPNGVLGVEGGMPEVFPKMADDCIECQHCLAVCPTGALSVFDLEPAKSIPLAQGSLPTRQQMKTLVRGRRSVRQYRAENVSRELIDELLSDLAHAPTGCNDRALEFLVVADGTEMRQLREGIVSAVETAVREGRPMPEFLLSAVVAFRRDGIDNFFRDAPHLLVVSAEDRASCGKQDIVLALAYFELLAQSAGLGTTWCGFLDFAVAAAPEIANLLGFEKNTPFYSMMFGHAAVKYARTVQRDSAAAIRRYHHG